MRAKNAGASGLPERRESYDHNRATGLDSWAAALANVAENTRLMSTAKRIELWL